MKPGVAVGLFLGACHTAPAEDVEPSPAGGWRVNPLS